MCWLVLVPCTSGNTARRALGRMDEHVGKWPTTVVNFTHSHAGHFGGVLGVTTKEDVDAGRCQIVAPIGFLHETVGENVIAGPAMGRRATYQFGPMLPPGPTGHVDCGLGTGVPMGPPGLLAPTTDITFTGEELVLDGVRVIFQLTPETEAPAEMNFFFPDHGWLCMAENCSQTMHNLVPIRGALVRNALNWSKYINQSIELFAAKTKILVNSQKLQTGGTSDVRESPTLKRTCYNWRPYSTITTYNQIYNQLKK